ncbi:MAG: slipin family protein [Pseudomonadota bacterium]
MLKMIDALLGRQTVLVKENNRALHLYKGQLQGILMPGEHVLANRQNRLELEWHDLARPQFTSAYDKALFDKLPDVAAQHLTVVETGADEVAIVEGETGIEMVVAADTRVALWTASGPWTVTRVGTSNVTPVEEKLLRRLAKAGLATGRVTSVTVPHEHVAVQFVDGVLQADTLHPGRHAFWAAGRELKHTLVDMKRQTLDVTGQELLTRDRVTIRVNVSAEYRVMDAVKAVTSVKDYTDALYRALQTVFRKTLGAMTLDQILENKVTVDAEAVKAVRADMAEVGLDVAHITLKDVILPGEMRDILNTVVAAQKEAEANVIRRREETNATRSLLNTAKVMAENPVMLRLKELEALEGIAGKVERLTVHNGTDGLMNDLVRLRDQ